MSNNDDVSENGDINPPNTVSAAGPSTDTHERDIPSIAASLSQVTASDHHVQYSFALANSLAVFKRLTWEQTPWATEKMEHIHDDICSQVEVYVELHTGRPTTAKMFKYALLFGAAYDPSSQVGNSGAPRVFVVFPRMNKKRKLPVYKDEAFLRVWHDDIVRPAFNSAWEDSGLVDLEGRRGFLGRSSLTSNARHHAMEAKPVVGFLEHLRNGNKTRVHTTWPAWMDSWDHGHEGKFSDIRAKIYDEAWKSITGMLKDYPGMEEFQDPYLLLVSHARTDLNPSLSLARIYEGVGRQWDKYVDSRYIKPGTFKIVLQTVLGDVNPFEAGLDDDEAAEEEAMMGVQFKRMSDSDEEPPNKRPRLST
jgi:hypothetical protein